MREFTKSMMSYTWAMSLFGVQQMFNVLRPSKAVESFENVTGATEEELGRSLQKPICGLVQWSMDNVGAIHEAQARYDRDQAEAA